MDTDLLRQYAFKFIGLPYKWGGQHPSEGYDCSGLCVELLQAQGVLRHGSDYTAKGLYKYLVTHSSSIVINPSFGAIAFFGQGWDAPARKQITHCAFCLDDETMLEAGGGASDTTTKKVAIRRRAFVRLRPIVYRKDLVGLLLP